MNKAIKENEKLAYSVLSNEFPMFCNDEELKMLALEWLFIACKHYDETKGYKFSTFAYNCIRNGLYRYFRLQNTKKRKCDNLIRLDAPLLDTEKDCGCVIDKIISDNKIYSDVENKELINNAFNNLSEKQRNRVQLSLQGYTYKEIARRENVNSRAVQQSVAQAKRSLSEELKLCRT